MFSYSCHRFLLLQEICHRDLKLENTLLDGSTTPRLKICDFGYSKVFFLQWSSLPWFNFRVIYLLSDLFHSCLLCSLVCCTRNLNLLWARLHTLHPRFSPERNMMEKYELFMNLLFTFWFHYSSLHSNMLCIYIYIIYRLQMYGHVVLHCM